MSMRICTYEQKLPGRVVARRGRKGRPEGSDGTEGKRQVSRARFRGKSWEHRRRVCRLQPPPYRASASTDPTVEGAMAEHLSFRPHECHVLCQAGRSLRLTATSYPALRYQLATALRDGAPALAERVADLRVGQVRLLYRVFVAHREPQGR